MNTRREFIKSTGTGIGAFSLTGFIPMITGKKDFYTKRTEKSGKDKPYFIETLPEYIDADTETLKVGICQVYTEPWDLDNNYKRTLAAIEEAAGKGAEIAVTPECVIHGYSWDDSRGKSDLFRKQIFAAAEDPEGERLSIIKNLAKRLGIYILTGFVEKGLKNKIHNTAALISPDGSYVYKYRKVHCRHFESIRHWGYFTPGNQFYSENLNFGQKNFNVGTMICFDREIPESLRCLRALNSEIVLCPLATDTSDLIRFNNRADNEQITRIRATSNELFIVVVNHAGRFNGGSFIVGPMGEVFCQLTENPEVVVYDVPVGAIGKKFHSEPLGWMGWGYRREEVYKKYI
jgi:N-carbamoylputrescine amidase